MITREFPVPIGKQAWQAPGQMSYGYSLSTLDTPVTGSHPTPFTPFTPLTPLTPDDLFSSPWGWIWPSDFGSGVTDMDVDMQPGALPSQKAPCQSYAQKFASDKAQQNHQQHFQHSFQQSGLFDSHQQFQQNIQPSTWQSSQQGFGASLPQNFMFQPNVQLDAQANVQMNTQASVWPDYQSIDPSIFEWNHQTNAYSTVQQNVQPSFLLAAQSNMQLSLQPSLQSSIQPNDRFNVQPKPQPNLQLNTQKNRKRPRKRTIPQIEQPLLPRVSNTPIVPTSHPPGILQPLPRHSAATYMPSSHVPTTNNTRYGSWVNEWNHMVWLNYVSKVGHVRQIVFQELSESSQMKAFDMLVRLYGPRLLLGPDDPSKGP